MISHCDFTCISSFGELLIHMFITSTDFLFVYLFHNINYSYYCGLTSTADSSERLLQKCFECSSYWDPRLQ